MSSNESNSVVTVSVGTNDCHFLGGGAQFETLAGRVATFHVFPQFLQENDMVVAYIRP